MWDDWQTGFRPSRSANSAGIEQEYGRRKLSGKRFKRLCLNLIYIQLMHLHSGHINWSLTSGQNH